MPCQTINSVDDPRLAVYRHLKRTNDTRWRGLFVAEGEKLVRRLLASRHEVVSLLLGQRYVDEFEPLVGEEVPIYVVPDRLVEAIIGFNFHRGVLACGRRPNQQGLGELLAGIGGRATVVVCPEIHDPENLGVLLRSSLALGVDAALLGHHASDPFSRRVLRTSMGAVLDLPIGRARAIEPELIELRERFGFELVATVTDPRATRLGESPRSPRTALLFGNEAHGLPASLVDLCDRRVTIAIEPAADSLNVASAAAIILYHYAALSAVEVPGGQAR
jgi:tRNA G18 (ribose-2'-O)-methylase SpoU